MRDVEREQIEASADEDLLERLAALRARYDPRGDGGGYPMAQLRELHLIQDELRRRQDDDAMAARTRQQ